MERPSCPDWLSQGRTHEPRLTIEIEAMSSASLSNTKLYTLSARTELELHTLRPPMRRTVLER